jgi:hypothetical protein
MQDTEVFKGKTFHQIMSEIHSTTLDRRGIILDIVGELRKMITCPDEAVLIAPLVRDYLETLVKNDDQLTKLATIVQRMISAESYKKTGGETGELLSEKEKEQLFRELGDEAKALEKKLQSMPTTP